MISSASDTEYYPDYMAELVPMDVVESPGKSVAPWISAPGFAQEATERALVCVAYDTMARRTELVALDLEDLDFLPDGTGRACRLQLAMGMASLRPKMR